MSNFRELIHSHRVQVEFQGKPIDALVQIFVSPEDVDPADMYDRDPMDEDVRRIKEGSLNWSVVTVEASFGVIEGFDHLGAVAWETTNDVLETVKMHDMEDQAIKDMLDQLQGLIEQFQGKK